MHTPERGEHTDEVLAEFGFSKDEIEALKKIRRDVTNTPFVPAKAGTQQSRSEGPRLSLLGPRFRGDERMRTKNEQRNA